MNLKIRNKISKALKGNKNALGRKVSEKTKLKISNALKGKKFSKERLENMSLAAKKRHVPCSSSKRKILSLAYPYKRKVLCLQNKIIYSAVQQCAEHLNLHASSISAACKGKLKHVKGYTFVYINN